ncbi:MetQ/NlpA family ABC transporter substrate-binding protein [Actinobacillus pleuropneumoniae]|uniref:Lipoprotein n=1 Tax=Actinobacillus pleuropneumoniae serotype 7 (strain AP76) TaxID=537457 RepID=B3GXQ6_ACTP7|nr:MetQ/NlpA family ABC transporter substrate-binding protein [Actinobacillus pleuropneumoniae]ACE61621.1 outer membrane lipoprotein 2 precursor [Actinobacillus pleuropneumoniae serovar 7 str. AP76]EFM96446.1 Outer membrane lipoprotein 1 [Actinobacillus pleuropneumoniae serovar 10 str. D13039]EFN02949.1 Outer membrane lipoprotein 1 [Actinobacillus pleuropneumoniae serovar 13 str. N273]UKH18459.1 MetQ/NlpA family ABC transporter substrate-binding protein [Actinobacillus pleuropneumoniae]UKH3280
MNLKKLFGLAVVSALALTGCKEEKAADTAKAEARTLTVGVMQGPEAQVNEVAARIAKEKYNLDVKLVEFSEYTQPNYALSHGDLDVNAFQSVPFFEREMKEKGYKFVAQANTFVFPIAGYSKTVKAIADLKEGAKIAISNELSTAGRSLLLLQANGVIKLKDPTNLYATEVDIVENPKNVKISQIDTALLTRALDDVDLAIINNNYAGQAGLTPEKDGVIVEAKDSPYVNLIVSREDNKDNPAIKDFIKAFQTEEVYQEALKHFPGGIVKGW